MNKWLLTVPFLLVAIRWVAIESFERYSEVPVCEEQESWWGAPLRSCSAYDQVLAGNYKVIKGEVYWEHKTYAPEFGCGQGPGAIGGNLISFKCWMQRDGYARTVEHRSLTKVEKLSPCFKVLEGAEPGLLAWQKEQSHEYAVGEQGVYLNGWQLKGADPKKFSVIFPLGNQEYWRFLNISRSGKSTFVGRQDLGEVDLTQFHLLETPDCLKVNAECTADELSKLFHSRGGGVVGVVCNDVVALGTYDSVRVENKASPGMYVFSHKAERYLRTQGAFYKLTATGGELVESVNETGDGIIWFQPDYRPYFQHPEEYLTWQQEQFQEYGVTDDGVYFRGQRLEGANPKDFKVVFPFGQNVQWKMFYLSTSGGVLFNGEMNIGNADFQKLKILPPCEVSMKGVSVACWSLQKILSSASEKGVVAQLGHDIYYFHRRGVTGFIGAALTDFYVFELDGVFYMNRGGENYRLLRGGGKFASLVLDSCGVIN